MTQPQTQKYPCTKCIAIDVDGTLVINGQLNAKLARWAKEKKLQGFEVILWSARGKQHAESMANKFSVLDCFSTVISKPGYIIDDLGWTWTRYARVLHGWR